MVSRGAPDGLARRGGGVGGRGVTPGFVQKSGGQRKEIHIGIVCGESESESEMGDDGSREGV